MKQIAIFLSFIISISADQLKVPSQYSTIQAAIDAASEGDTVYVAAGRYKEGINIDQRMVLIGESKETTVIEGGTNVDVVKITNNSSSGNVVLKEFTIEYGGDGIWIISSSFDISDVIIHENGGAGIRINASVGKITNAVIRKNGSSSKWGGGIRMQDQSGGKVDFSNVLIADNTCIYHGCAVYISNADATFNQVTIVNNKTNDGKVENNIHIYKESDVKFTNSILWNKKPAVVDPSGYDPAKLSISYSIVEGGWSTIGSLGSKPYFLNPSEGIYSLIDHSPGIGGGSTEDFPVKDILGNPRPSPAGSNPDMGAYENVWGEPQKNNPPSSFKWVDSKKDTINITKENLDKEYKFEWTASTDSDGDKLSYILHAKIGSTPWQEINEDIEGTSFESNYGEFLEAAFEAFPIVNAVTAAFKMEVTDGIDTVKMDDIPKVIYIRRYDYLSTIDDQIPTDFSLHENYPNPFNPATTLRFDLPEASDVNVVIYNMLGQKVRTFNMNSISAGSHSIKWNATNDLGDPVGAGVYLYQLQAKDFVKTRKMVLLK